MADFHWPSESGNPFMCKSPDQVGFAVNPRRWAVECLIAWISQNRRLAEDFAATIDSARAVLYSASVMLPVRRLGRAL